MISGRTRRAGTDETRTGATRGTAGRTIIGQGRRIIFTARASRATRRGVRQGKL